MLVGCVATKQTESAPTKDLYRSTLWRGRRRHAESRGVPWFILSAFYGLVEPERHLDPYNLALTDLSASQRRAWGDGVVVDLAERLSLAGESLRFTQAPLIATQSRSRCDATARR